MNSSEYFKTTIFVSTFLLVLSLILWKFTSDRRVVLFWSEEHILLNCVFFTRQNKKKKLQQDGTFRPEIHLPLVAKVA